MRGLLLCLSLLYSSRPYLPLFVDLKPSTTTPMVSAMTATIHKRGISWIRAAFAVVVFAAAVSEKLWTTGNSTSPITTTIRPPMTPVSVDDMSVIMVTSITLMVGFQSVVIFKSFSFQKTYILVASMNRVCQEFSSAKKPRDTTSPSQKRSSYNEKYEQATSSASTQSVKKTKYYSRSHTKKRNGTRNDPMFDQYKTFLKSSVDELETKYGSPRWSVYLGMGLGFCLLSLMIGWTIYK